MKCAERFIFKLSNKYGFNTQVTYLNHLKNFMALYNWYSKVFSNVFVSWQSFIVDIFFSSVVDDLCIIIFNIFKIILKALSLLLISSFTRSRFTEKNIVSKKLDFALGTFFIKKCCKFSDPLFMKNTYHIQYRNLWHSCCI